MLTAREPFYRVGGDFSFNYHAFNLFGQYMYGRDQNLLPLLPAGFCRHPQAFSGEVRPASVAASWKRTICRCPG